MANANANNVGQAGLAGDDLALFKEIWSGEVITSFKEKTIMEGLTYNKTITNGKSAYFPLIGGVSAAYHTKGTEITGQNIEHEEEIISIDGKLISDVFIDVLDEKMNEYDVTSRYSAEMGSKLADLYDENVMKEVVKAARASNKISTLPGGTQVDLPASYATDDAATKGVALYTALLSSAQAMDEKNVPMDGRYCIFKPAEFYFLMQNTDVLNKDYSGSGDISKGTLPEVSGIQIIKNNKLPSTDTSVSDTKHGVDASLTKGIVFTSEAVGTVKLMDLFTKITDDTRRLGKLIVSGYGIGHGVLRPECAVEIKLAA